MQIKATNVFKVLRKAINKFKALRKAINVFKAIMELIKSFCGSNALWNYVVVNASLRSYIIHHDQSGLSAHFIREKGEKKINSHNVIKR